MSNVSRRAVTAFAIAGLGATTLVGVAQAHTGSLIDDGAYDNAKNTHGHDQHFQHGDADGHLAPVDRNVDLVSKLRLSNVSPGKIADVGVYKNHAYLAAWGGVTCKTNGVHVVNISDVRRPREVAFIVSKEGSYPGEGVQALTLTTPSFSGDVLVTNNETCKAKAGFGGMNLYDVSNPAHPTPLAVGVGDSTLGGNRKKSANEIHSVFAWDAGDRAYAVIVDNEENIDVDIMDITDPRRPFLAAEYDLVDFVQRTAGRDITQDGLDEVFLHDMVVKRIGTRFIMLLAYWDAGYVKLDVTDVRAPRYLADSDYAAIDPEAAESGLTVPPEGNGHQVEFTRDNRFVVGTDEDFAPHALRALNITDGTQIDASQGSDTRRLTPGTTIEGTAVFFGRGCTGDPSAGTAPAVGTAQVAVVERGLCTFTEKVANVIAAGGYEAVLIFNRTGTDACDAEIGMIVEGDIPTFGVAPRGQGFAIFGQPYDNATCLAGTGPERLPVAPGTTGDVLNFTSFFDGWGYVHLFRPGTMAELDTYAIPEAHDEAFAIGFGDLTVHEVATSRQDASLAYLSYYAGGLRVIRVGDTGIREVGAFIDVGGNNFWGVDVFSRGTTEYVAASDRDFGLYIFRFNPAG